MKEEILSLMKDHLKSIVDNLSYENLEEMREEMNMAFSVLDTTHHMASFVHQEDPEEPEELGEDDEDEDDSQEYLDELQTMIEEVEETEAYRFERRIRGGILEEIGAFVPEKVVQDLGIEHGDYLHAKLIEKNSNGPDHYEYRIAEKGPGIPLDDIIEVNMGVVEYFPRFGGLGVSKTVNNGEIFYEGEPITLRITDADADAMDLEEGDIVNLAFYESRPEYVKIRWRYNIDDMPVKEAPKPSSYYKAKTDSEPKEYEQIFEGKTICVMGTENKWGEYREEVERRGGSLVTLTGKENTVTIAAALRKSDCLILTIQNVGHGGTKRAVPMAKGQGIPYDSIDNYGRTTFINKAVELLSKE